MHRTRIQAGVAALLTALALAATAAAPALAAPAHAASAPTFVLSGGVGGGGMLLHGHPGQTLYGSVEVHNLTARRIEVILQAADIRTAGNGNAAYSTVKLSLAGRWLKLASGRVDLGPYGSDRVTFSVAVPPGTSGASHFAGIVGSNAAEVAAAARRKGHAAKSPAYAISRVSRQAVPITVRTPGPLTRSSPCTLPRSRSHRLAPLSRSACCQAAATSSRKPRST